MGTEAHNHKFDEEQEMRALMGIFRDIDLDGELREPLLLHTHTKGGGTGSQESGARKGRRGDTKLTGATHKDALNPSFCRTLALAPHPKHTTTAP